MGKFKHKRWISLFAGMGIEALAGVSYAWSVFQIPLIEKYGWSVSQVSMALSINMLGSMISSILLGEKIRKAMSIRKEILLGSFLYAVSIAAIAFVKGNLVLLYVFYGVICSIGLSFVYPVLISYALQLFPEYSGFAGGLMTAGYGLGGMLWAPLAAKIHIATNDINCAFLTLGTIFLVGMVLLSFLIYTPPNGFHAFLINEKTTSPAQRTEDNGVIVALYDVNKKQMIHLPLFYVAFVASWLGASCGNMIINQGAPIMAQIFGVSATSAAAVVGLMSGSNIFGRLFWGRVSDRLGKARSFVLVFGLMAGCLMALVVTNQQLFFTTALLGTTFCFGGIVSMVAPLTAELFGDRCVIENYSVMYCIFGLSSLAGPMLIAAIRDLTGEYTKAFVCAVAFACVGFILSLVMVRVIRQRKSDY